MVQIAAPHVCVWDQACGTRRVGPSVEVRRKAYNQRHCSCGSRGPLKRYLGAATEGRTRLVCGFHPGQECVWGLDPSLEAVGGLVAPPSEKIDKETASLHVQRYSVYILSG